MEKLRLGNLDSKRDWGHARDYVEAMWLMLQQDEPDDYVIATGVTRSVRDFVLAAFAAAGLDWEKYVVIDEAYMRPAEVHELRGDASKAARKLGWKPTTTFGDLVREMLETDMKLEGVDPAKHLKKVPAAD
jgi:GDPmannose 4,6-dehydratase